MRFAMPAPYALARRLTILRDASPTPDPQAVALAALGWLLADEDRAMRFLVMTGLSAEDLRAALGEDATLAAVLDFLCAHEPDLLAAADALGHTPLQLVAARDALAGDHFDT
jgi:hypothetical protein